MEIWGYPTLKKNTVLVVKSIIIQTIKAVNKLQFNQIIKIP